MDLMLHFSIWILDSEIENPIKPNQPKHFFFPPWIIRFSFSFSYVDGEIVTFSSIVAVIQLVSSIHRKLIDYNVPHNVHFFPLRLELYVNYIYDLEMWASVWNFWFFHKTSSLNLWGGKKKWLTAFSIVIGIPNTGISLFSHKWKGLNAFSFFALLTFCCISSLNIYKWSVISYVWLMGFYIVTM